jgi:hypothetical protein
MADEEALRPICELLEHVRERVDYAITRKVIRHARGPEGT